MHPRRAMRDLLVIVTLASTTSATAQVGTGPLNGQRFWGEMTVDVDPQEIWSVLTDQQGFCGIFGITCPKTDQPLLKVGDSFLYNPEDGDSPRHGDRGHYIVAHIEELKELRITWEPSNGSYLCQVRFRILPGDDGTRVLFEERYTLSGVMSPEALRDEIAYYTETMARLQEVSEAATRGPMPE